MSAGPTRRDATQVVHILAGLRWREGTNELDACRFTQRRAVVATVAVVAQEIMVVVDR